MPNLLRSASSVLRLGGSVGNRITESLLSSNGKVAGVGLATSVLTLVFAIWFGLELRHESKVSTPLARAAAAMNASINQSIAELRAWAAYRDTNAVVERRRIWIEQIEPTMVSLDQLADAADDAETIALVGDLENNLRLLKRIQWAIEDVAQTPGNEPAAVAYEMKLEPLRRSVLKSLDVAITERELIGKREEPFNFLALLARFRTAFAQGDLALTTLVNNYSDVQEHTFTQQFTEARRLAEQIRGEVDHGSTDDFDRLLLWALDEFKAYDLQVHAIIKLRRSATWNVTQLLFAQDAKPLVERSRAIAGDLAESQAVTSAHKAVILTRASFVVIVMALVMGLLSGGSLLVSYRLQQHVRNVMAKAKMLGQYEIERKIGEGGMGQVYLAKHAMLRRPTAIKLLNAASAQSLRARNRFQQEVQLTCQLSHPNTIEIFDYGRTPEGIFYYAMEYLEGFTLETLVALVGPVPPARVVNILLQACGSLQEAHDHGLLHRDIKPSNIMLTKQGGLFDTVKLLDFGLVKDLTSQVSTQVNEIAGTPMYLAPESILTAEAGSPAADIYAMGAVGYFLLAGTTLFESAEVSDILSKQINEYPLFPSERIKKALPEDLEYVLMACLAKDPNDRPESASRLAELIRACDCDDWSDHDARLWWEQYGETARNLMTVMDTSRPGPGSGLEVVVGSSRGRVIS